MIIKYDLTEDDLVDFSFYSINKDKKDNIKNIMNFAIISFAIFLPDLLTFLKTGEFRFFNLFLAVVILWAGIFIRTKRSVRKRALKLLRSGKNVTILGTKTIEFKEASLIVRTEFIYAELKWNSFEYFRESKEHLLLFEAVNQAIIIPKRIFLLPQEEHDVRSFIERKLAEQK